MTRCCAGILEGCRRPPTAVAWWEHLPRRTSGILTFRRDVAGWRGGIREAPDAAPPCRPTGIGLSVLHRRGRIPEKSTEIDPPPFRRIARAQHPKESAAPQEAPPTARRRDVPAPWAPA